MTRHDLLRRVKRRILMGLYETEDKWAITMARMAADIHSANPRRQPREEEQQNALSDGLLARGDTERLTIQMPRARQQRRPAP
jgi:hypothetical protein